MCYHLVKQIFHVQKRERTSVKVKGIGKHRVHVPFESKIFLAYFMKTAENIENQLEEHLILGKDSREWLKNKFINVLDFGYI